LKLCKCLTLFYMWVCHVLWALRLKSINQSNQIIDATGSVILDDRKCYAYEIVVRHPQPGNPPLAVASCFTTSHNIPSISYFINSFCNAESTTYKNKKTIPKLVMCDGSVALIQSVVLSFFKKTLQSYLDRWFANSCIYCL